MKNDSCCSVNLSHWEPGWLGATLYVEGHAKAQLQCTNHQVVILSVQLTCGLSYSVNFIEFLWQSITIKPPRPLSIQYSTPRTSWPQWLLHSATVNTPMEEMEPQKDAKHIKTHYHYISLYAMQWLEVLDIAEKSPRSPRHHLSHCELHQIPHIFTLFWCWDCS